MPWYYEVAEREHEIQNPTSTDRIRQLGEHLRLTPDRQVLDVSSGRGGPALILAKAFGCRITSVERSAAFVEAARGRARRRGLERLVEFHLDDASEFPLEPEAYDVAMCLGASFVWGGLEGTLERLVPTARPGGHVVVGEPYWRQLPLPHGFEPHRDEVGLVSLEETAAHFRAAGLDLTAIVASSEEDWDRYESLHWRSVEEWLAQNPDDPDAAEIGRMHRESRKRYLTWQRDLMGWAIFAAAKG